MHERIVRLKNEVWFHNLDIFSVSNLVKNRIVGDGSHWRNEVSLLYKLFELIFISIIQDYAKYMVSVFVSAEMTNSHNKMGQLMPVLSTSQWHFHVH